MKKQLVITDLTRMQRRTVCIAGYDKNGHCIRPVLPPPGIPEHTLIKQGQPIIFPFAIVEFDLLQPTPQPPHSEDCRYNAASLRFVRRVRDREKVLQQSLFENVQALFEQTIHTDWGFYVMDGQGPRSLGTIRPREVTKAMYEQGPEGPWDYRLIFVDAAGDKYRLKITDLTWHYYCDSLRGEDRGPVQITTALTAMLKPSTVYLRIGLARGWKEYPDRCYLQITGIYTFPDYLGGKTFADFAPK